MNFEIKSGQFVTEDGLNLNYKSWTVSGSAPSAVYLHGLESHMGWFSNLAEFLASSGINVYAFDRRGSGSNKEGCKNFCKKYIFSDLKIFLDLVKNRDPHGRIFLIGLCLGGKIAANFLSAYPDSVHGLILMSPSIKSRLKFGFLDKLSMLFSVHKKLKIPIEDRMFTSNKFFLEYIEKDPLRLRSIPARYLMEIAKMDHCMGSNPANIKVPILLMLAGFDEIIDTAGVERWYYKVSSVDRTLYTYKDYHHILTFEQNADLVMRDMADWINARADAKSIAH